MLLNPKSEVQDSLDARITAEPLKTADFAGFCLIRKTHRRVNRVPVGFCSLKIRASAVLSASAWKGKWNREWTPFDANFNELERSNIQSTR